MVSCATESSRLSYTEFRGKVNRKRGFVWRETDVAVARAATAYLEDDLTRTSLYIIMMITDE